MKYKVVGDALSAFVVVKECAEEDEYDFEIYVNSWRSNESEPFSRPVIQLWTSDLSVGQALLLKDWLDTAALIASIFDPTLEQAEIEVP